MSAEDTKLFYIEETGLTADYDGKIRHGFFGRTGGVSKGIYSSLNCGPGSDDDPVAVRENRALVAAQMGAAPENLLSLNQIHSARCMTVDQPWTEDDKPQADAMVTDRPGLALGVLTADCAPVLFAAQRDDGAVVIGAAHAGWGGALKGVLENAIEAMQALGADLGRIRAVIGPCIGPESYEVSEDFRAPFMDQEAANSVFFKPAARPGHLMFDLPGYCAYRLSLQGVGHVAVRAVDTFFNEEDFFSYRRSTHRREPDYGRQISAIMIAP